MKTKKREGEKKKAYVSIIQSHTSACAQVLKNLLEPSGQFWELEGAVLTGSEDIAKRLHNIVFLPPKHFQQALSVMPKKKGKEVHNTQGYPGTIRQDTC